jgi:hypothetical protein
MAEFNTKFDALNTQLKRTNEIFQTFVGKLIDKTGTSKSGIKPPEPFKGQLADAQ